MLFYFSSPAYLTFSVDDPSRVVASYFFWELFVSQANVIVDVVWHVDICFVVGINTQDLYLKDKETFCLFDFGMSVTW